MHLSKTELRTNEVLCLAACIYFEARGESDEAQHWVGHVVLNRVKHQNFPNTIYEVVFQKSQFSWTVGHSEFTLNEVEAWKNSIIKAKLILKDSELDPTSNCLFFLGEHCNPKWKRRLRHIRKLGHLEFFSY